MSYTAAQSNNPLAPPPPPPHSPTQPSSSSSLQSQGSPVATHTAVARPAQPAHKRTYQACIPCRQRKVRCDLGSVEAPHDPPCVRCRRESKECFFSATRRKRTPSAEILPGLGRGRGVRRLDEGIENGDGKRVRTLPHSDQPIFRSPEYGQSSPTFSQPQQQQQPYSHAIDPQLSRPQPLQPPLHPTQTAQHGATTTETLLQTEVYNSHEALLTLIEAAGKDTPMDSSGMKSESRSPSTEVNDSVPGEHTRPASSNQSHHHSPVQPSSVRWNQSVHFAEADSVAGSSTSYASSLPHRQSASHISPKTQTTPRSQPIALDDGMEKALKAWNKFRFVKAGWFTAREAISFVEYFYKHLHPLSPTLTNPTLLHVSHPRHHHLLLRHEPFLATTILTVASRYLTLPDPGGQSRSFAIHDMLWREVRGAFERLMWGGGWGGLGVPRPVGMSNLAVDPANDAKTGRGLRTIGTVEGLLILTEWHVRGLHFPMDVEESDLGIDLTDDESAPPHDSRPHRVVEGLGDKIENILEPAYRSDRMSWMLLGNALALAYELGVFDETIHTTTTPPPALRSKRIQKLLLVYILQLASRLGWTSMIPRGVRDSVRHHRPTPTPTSWSNPDELQDAVYNAWVDLTILMNSSSELLFPSRARTKSIMRSNEYVELLDHFRPLLKSWKDAFLALNLPSPIHLILVLEYEHVRFYINSLALQAVIDRCSQRRGVVPQIGRRDTEFIREVVSASRSLLTTVIEEMFPAGYLKHAPVRIYLRILSASMFLLKTFSLGARGVEVDRSMELIEGVCGCLRNAAVDDVHLGLRFADLLGGLAGRVRGALEKMVVDSGTPGNEGGGQEEEAGYVWEGSGEEVLEGWGQWGNEDWLALPLDPILGFEGVTQGTMGVDVGGMDLLEVLLT